MLDKIVAIKNVGRIRDYSAKGDVTFRRLTLIHAENGRGKTTLCGILRSLQTGEPEHVAERETLGAQEGPSLHLRLQNRDYRFSSGAWSATYPDVLIFDPVFVGENVHSGDYVEHEQKKNLYRVVVGAEGVRLAREIEEIDGQIRNANSELQTKRNALARFVPVSTTLEEYLQWERIADVESLIAQKTEELQSRERAAARSEEILGKPLLRQFVLPSVPPEFAKVLERGLVSVAADAEAKVRQQITDRGMGQRGEHWLAEGVEYAGADQCPFCGQDMTANELIGAYRAYFSAEYADLKRDVVQLRESVDQAIGDAAIAAAHQVIGDNATLCEFWKQFTGVEVPEISFQQVQHAYAALHKSALELLCKKEQSPTEPIPPDGGYTTALVEIDELQALTETYNRAADSANQRLAAFQAVLTSGEDSSTLEAELANFKANEERFDATAAEACTDYQGTLAMKAGLQATKEARRGELDQHCEDLIGSYEQSINDLLDQFGARFRLRNARHLYTGGTPSCQYQVEINSSPVDLGDPETPAGTPCFRTCLSSGDRSALAFAFFLAVVERDPDIAAKIVVFDDPFTSLDRFRRTWTQQLIIRVAAKAEQVIVLSHDAHFLAALHAGCDPAAEVKPLQMSRSGAGTVIGEWDMDEAVKSSYEKDYSALLLFARERKGELRAVARAIRPFLEGLLRAHFPGHFLPNEWLGDFIGKIRNAAPASGLDHAKNDLHELEDINGYSKKYHHEQNANADAEPIDEDELHSYVKRTLRLVGGE